MRKEEYDRFEELWELFEEHLRALRPDVSTCTNIMRDHSLWDGDSDY